MLKNAHALKNGTSRQCNECASLYLSIRKSKPFLFIAKFRLESILNRCRLLYVDARANFALSIYFNHTFNPCTQIVNT